MIIRKALWEAGMRGDWDLSQPTLRQRTMPKMAPANPYDLAQDKAEAARVAKLSPYQQLKYVMDRDTGDLKAKSGHRIPKAGDPPTHTARGQIPGRRLMARQTISMILRKPGKQTQNEVGNSASG